LVVHRLQKTSWPTQHPSEPAPAWNQWWKTTCGGWAMTLSIP